MRIPNIVYANFEDLNHSVDKNISNFTRQIYNLIQYSYCYVTVRSEGVTSKLKYIVV